MNDKKTNNKVGVFGKLKKVLNSIVKSYISEVETNSSVEVGVFEKKFDGVKKTILEDQAKLKEEIRLTKSELKEVMAAAKKSVIDLYNGKVSFEDDFMEEFGDFDFDDEDFEEFDESAFESEVTSDTVPIQSHIPEERLNQIALSLLFNLAKADSLFAKFMQENENLVLDIISRVKVLNINPDNTPYISHKAYVDLSCEALELASSFQREPIDPDHKENDNPEARAIHNEKRDELLDDIIEIVEALMDVYMKDDMITLAVHGILNKVYAVYLEYHFYHKDGTVADTVNKEETKIGVIHWFLSDVFVNKVRIFDKFGYVCVIARNLEHISFTDFIALGIAFSFGLLNLSEKHVELHERLVQFIVKCNNVITNQNDIFEEE